MKSFLPSALDPVASAVVGGFTGVDESNPGMAAGIAGLLSSGDVKSAAGERWRGIVGGGGAAGGGGGGGRRCAHRRIVVGALGAAVVLGRWLTRLEAAQGQSLARQRGAELRGAHLDAVGGGAR